MYAKENENLMMHIRTGGFDGLNRGLGMVGMGNKFFYFEGNSLSLQARIDSLTDEDVSGIVDAQIKVTGVEIQSMNNWSMMCTMIWGSIIILPLLFLCMDWWRRCTLPAFSISQNVYVSLGKLIRASNIRNLTLNVTDNTFD